jgi:hypothetical protein
MSTAQQPGLTDRDPAWFAAPTALTMALIPGSVVQFYAVVLGVLNADSQCFGECPEVERHVQGVGLSFFFAGLLLALITWLLPRRRSWRLARWLVAAAYVPLVIIGAVTTFAVSGAAQG